MKWMGITTVVAHSIAQIPAHWGNSDSTLVLSKVINHPDYLVSVLLCALKLYISPEPQVGMKKSTFDDISEAQMFRHPIQPPKQFSLSCQNTQNTQELREHSCNICRAEYMHTQQLKRFRSVLWGIDRFAGSGGGAWRWLRWRDAVASYQKRTTLT